MKTFFLCFNTDSLGEKKYILSERESLMNQMAKTLEENWGSGSLRILSRNPSGCLIVGEIPSCFVKLLDTYVQQNKSWITTLEWDVEQDTLQRVQE